MTFEMFTAASPLRLRICSRSLIADCVHPSHLWLLQYSRKWKCPTPDAQLDGRFGDPHSPAPLGPPKASCAQNVTPEPPSHLPALTAAFRSAALALSPGFICCVTAVWCVSLSEPISFVSEANDLPLRAAVGTKKDLKSVCWS